MSENRMNASHLRIGNFTSSEIIALISEPTAAAKKEGAIFGKAGTTYIEECNMERRLARSLNNETTSRPTSWGNLCERRVFELLPTDYRLCSQDTVKHPTIDFWAGSPDCEKYDEGKTCPDIKCPMTLKSFCQLVDPFYAGLTGMDAINKIRDTHKDGDKYYWQIVSNSILLDAKYGELVVYVPYKRELAEIRDEAGTWGNGDMNKLKWIPWANDDEMPYLIEGGYYKNLTVIRFEIPKEDKDFLTSRVIEAGKLLIERKAVIEPIIS